MKQLQPHARLHPQQGDVYNADDVARLVAGHEAVISAFNPGWANPDIYNLQVKGPQAKWLEEGLQKATVMKVYDLLK